MTSPVEVTVWLLAISITTKFPDRAIPTQDKGKTAIMLNTK